jgi:hypothetical protein
MMPMPNRSRAVKKAGERFSGIPKDQMRYFCLAMSFVVSLKGSQKWTFMKATIAISNTISKVFTNELMRPLPKLLLSLLDFPVSTSELSASTALLRCKELVQHKEQFQVQQQQHLLLCTRQDKDSISIRQDKGDTKMRQQKETSFL